MRIAVYRALYGEDFVRHSVESVLQAVDQIAFVYAGRPYADATEGVRYDGVKFKIPQPIDRMLERLPKDPRIRVFELYNPTPWGHWTRIFNEIVIPNYGSPDMAVCVFPVQVWRNGELDRAFEEFKRLRVPYANSAQVDIWRGFDWALPRLPIRNGANFLNLRMRPVKATQFDCFPCHVSQAPQLEKTLLHNLRNAQNPNTTFWKCMAVGAYAKAVGDSEPNPNWFEDKWLNWTPETTCLNMSKRWGHTSFKAEPYAVGELPELIQADLPALREATSNAAWKGYPPCE